MSEAHDLQSTNNFPGHSSMTEHRMRTEEEAQRNARLQIEGIRSKLSPDGRPELALLIKNALDILANELYDTATHFILELLQNADDNKYELEPTLKFTFESRTLRVDCNEVGFDKQNVKALCAIRSSSKSGQRHAEGYTGEKGIGFKSVFRVADEVSIFSREYSFKFDKKEEFGMIAPTWIESPKRHHIGTTMIFKLSDDYDVGELLEFFHLFDATYLLFLRRIRKIDVNLTFFDGTSQVKSLTRTDDEARGKDHSITSLQSGETELEYITRAHCVEHLPSEPRRPGYSESDLVLAFPITDLTAEPELVAQKVYASLPVSDYGFKFALQGDFLLTANRQSIDTSSLWNKALRDALAEAFVRSVHYFNKRGGPMKYAWPYYIPGHTVSEFFWSARTSILKMLEEEPALDSRAGDLVRAKGSDLVYVDLSKFADEDGQPFTSNAQTDARYLSSEYPPWTIESILSLGIPRLSEKSFLEDLTSLISSDPSEFRKRPIDWHVQLAKALVRLTGQPELMTALKALPIIPISNGDWVAAKDAPVFFQGIVPASLPGVAQQSGSTRRSGLTRPDPKRHSSPRSLLDLLEDDSYLRFLPIVESPKPTHNVALNPKDFPFSNRMLIVDHGTMEEIPRRDLYERLGVKNMSQIEMCQHIADSHSSSSFQPSEWTPEELASHAKFLFDSSWGRRKSFDLWFATSSNKRCKGTEVYLSSALATARQGSTTKVLEALRSQFPTLSDAYLVDESKAWKEFLTETLGISKVPRLATSEHGVLSLSKEYAYLFRECHISDVLHSIHENWSVYTECLEQDGVQCQSGTKSDNTEAEDVALERTTAHDFRSEKSAARSPIQRVIDQIKTTTVRTRGGPCHLSRTTLTGLDAYLEEQIPSLPVLDIESSSDKLLRQRLSAFEIMVDNNVDYYLFCLRQIQGQHSPDPDVIEYIYEQIQRCYINNEDRIETAFEMEELIYLKPSSTRTKGSNDWISIDECSKRKINIKSDYIQCEDLFRWLFANRDVDVHSLVARASTINGSWCLSEIVELFSDIGTIIKDMPRSRAIRALKPLQHKRIFPITKKQTQLDYVLTSSDDPFWFIADRSHLKESFLGSIPLLSFTVTDFEGMEHLLKSLSVKNRKLSERTSFSTAPRPPIKPSQSKTFFLRNRAEFITSLIPFPESELKWLSLALQMHSITVLTAAKITETYELKHGKMLYSSRPCPKQAYLHYDGSVLKLFVEEDEFEPGRCSFDLVDSIAKHFQIEKSLHLKLLNTALSDSSVHRIQSIYAREGIMVRINGKEECSSRNFTSKSGSIYKIPSPFQYSGREDVNLSSESDEIDVDQVRHVGIGLKRQSHPRSLSDRRLKMMPIGYSKLNATPGVVLKTELDPNDTLRYLGQLMISQLFESFLGDVYQPTRHWTSELRSRAGLHGSDNFVYHAPFTMGDSKISSAVTKFFFDNGLPEISRWRTATPTYHFDVAPSIGDTDTTFVWSSSQIEMMRRLQFPEDPEQKPHDVLVLVRITNMHARPLFHFFVDPWRLLVSNHFKFSDDCSFEASLDFSAASSEPNEVENTMESDQQLAPSSQRLIPQSPTPISPLLVGAAGPQFGLPPSFPSGLYYDAQFPYTFMQQALEVLPYTVPNPFAFSTVDNPRGQGESALVSRSVSYTAYNREPHPADARFSSPSLSRSYNFPRASRDTSDVMHGRSKSPNSETRRGPRRTKQPEFKHSSTFLEAYEERPYQYRTLRDRELRLFILNPGQSHEPLRGTICEYHLDDIEPYSTLSYTWGPSDQSIHTLTTPEGTISIKASLSLALLRLRPKDGPVILWVDAICINQNDMAEKVKQIRLLPEIFQEACCTLAFLGSDGASDDALEMLLQIRANAVYGAKSKNWPDNLPRIPPSWEGRNVPPSEDPIWTSVASLFRRKWFQRAWIVQEAVAAPTVNVVCGKWQIDWNDLFFAMETVNHELGDNPEVDYASWRPFFTLANHREWEAKRARWSLLLLLKTYQHVDATIKSDRLFSLLGLAHDGHLPEFDPDYNLSWQAVSIRYARAFIAHGQGMQMLPMAGLHATDTNWPSWIPDWTRKATASLSESEERGVVFSASKSTAGEVKLILSHYLQITVKAIRFLVVDQVSDSCNVPDNLRKLGQHLKNIENMIDGCKHNTYNKQKREELKWRTPIANAQYLMDACAGELNVHESYKALLKLCRKVKHNPQKEHADSHRKSLTYRLLLGHAVDQWRFFITKDGHYGMAPPGVRAGDHVTLLAGGSVPFLLREAGNNIYQLVGECYAYGFMHGEGLRHGEFCDTVLV